MQRPSSSILANLDSILFPVNGQDVQQRLANHVENRLAKTVSLDVQAYIGCGGRAMEIEYKVYWAAPITRSNSRPCLSILLPSFRNPIKTMQVSIYHTRSELITICTMLS